MGDPIRVADVDRHAHKREDEGNRGFSESCNGKVMKGP